MESLDPLLLYASSDKCSSQAMLLCPQEVWKLILFRFLCGWMFWKSNILKLLLSILGLVFINFLCLPTVFHTYSPYSRLSESLNMRESETWISLRISRELFKAPASESHLRPVSLGQGIQSCGVLKKLLPWIAHLLGLIYHHSSVLCSPRSSCLLFPQSGVHHFKFSYNWLLFIRSQLKC